MADDARRRFDRLIPKRRVSAGITFLVAAVAVPAAGGLFPVAVEAWGVTAGFAVLTLGLAIGIGCLVLALLAIRRARQYGWDG